MTPFPAPVYNGGSMTEHSHAMADVAEFKRFLRADPSAAAFLGEQAAGPATLTRAPGRLDVMGGVADYSGSLVAEMTIAEAALVALAPRSDRVLRVWSRGIEAEGFTPQVSLSLDDFYSPNDRSVLLSYDAVRSRLGHVPETRWAAYVLGCVYVLLAEGIVPDFPHGANLLLDSRVPLGAGVSSSAAIEVAAMSAFNAAFHLNLTGVTLARLSQIVENKVVGAPCGIMDQMTSVLGVPNSLLLILCQPHEVQGTQALPKGVKVYGINSNIKHSVGGTAYTRARVAAFMGRKILGVDYLAQIEAGSSSTETAAEMPEMIVGADFLAEYGETGDLVTAIDPGMTYPLQAAVHHAIYESIDVKAFVSLLSPQRPADALYLAGDLMYESHRSYTRIGLGCPETDLLVELGRAAGPSKGIYGAKITGGGSGGTVAFLTYGERSEQTVHEIAEAYRQQTGRTPQIFLGGQSPGAAAFGSEIL